MACIFCKIASGEIKSDIVYSDNEIIGFKDINPSAPIHTLFIPKIHIEKITDITEKEIEIIGKLIFKASDYAKKVNLKEGFRLVINCGEHGGQAVNHIHIHLLGGRQMEWPPG